MPGTLQSWREVRRRPDEQEWRASFTELFFDLVFVLVVTQLSALLVDDLTVSGAAETLFLLLVAWWAWIYTTWATNWFDPNVAGAARARPGPHLRLGAGDGCRRRGRAPRKGRPGLDGSSRNQPATRSATQGGLGSCRNGYASDIESAYGSLAAFDAALPTHNPVDYAAELAGIPIKVWYSTDDPVCVQSTVTAFASGSGAATVSLGAVGHTAGTLNGQDVADYLLGYAA